MVGDTLNLLMHNEKRSRFTYNAVLQVLVCVSGTEGNSPAGRNQTTSGVWARVLPQGWLDEQPPSRSCWASGQGQKVGQYV